MKKTVLLIAVLLMASAAVAVTDYDGPEDQPHIMGAESGGSSSATTSVGPNGTKWSTTLSVTNITSYSNQSGEVTDVNFTGDKVSFNGEIQAPNPCYTLASNVTEQDGSYILDIYPVREETDRVCTQQLVMLDYEASFEADDPYTLQIQHSGEDMEEVEHPDYTEEPESNGGFFSGFMKWLGNLF